jgi:hypothetical protein
MGRGTNFLVVLTLPPPCSPVGPELLTVETPPSHARTAASIVQHNDLGL